MGQSICDKVPDIGGVLRDVVEIWDFSRGNNDYCRKPKHGLVIYGQC